MSTNLSQKAIREVFKTAEGPLNLEAIMDGLESNDVSYNGDILKGTLAVMVEKGYLLQPKRGHWAKKARTTGGGTPTVMFKVDTPFEPQTAKIEEMPYDKAAFEKDRDGDNLIGTTRAMAVRKAKARWYTEFYSPQLEAYRNMEDAEKADKAEKEDEADSGADAA